MRKGNSNVNFELEDEGKLSYASGERRTWETYAANDWPSANGWISVGKWVARPLSISFGRSSESTRLLFRVFISSTPPKVEPDSIRPCPT